MKSESVWFSHERTVEIREEEVPPCGPTQITVEAIVSGISSGTEMTIYRGQAPSKPTALDLSWDYFSPDPGGSFANRFPIKYAYSNVGRVLEAGAQSGFEPGDLVYARAPHESVFTIEADYQTRLPDNIPSLQSATTLGLLDVAVNAQLDWPTLLGDVVLVSGLGLVGQFSAQLAKRTAKHVICVDPLASRREMALRLGADAAVSPEDALEAVRQFSDGHGADVTIECSGAPSALQLCIEGAGREATVLIPAFYGLKNVPLVLSPEFHFRRLKLISSSTKEVDGRLGHRWSYQRRLALDVSLLGAMHADEMISHSIPFHNAAKAYRLIDEQPQDVLSIVLTYGDNR